MVTAKGIGLAAGAVALAGVGAAGGLYHYDRTVSGTGRYYTAKDEHSERVTGDITMGLAGTVATVGGGFAGNLLHQTTGSEVWKFSSGRTALGAAVGGALFAGYIGADLIAGATSRHGGEHDYVDSYDDIINGN